MKITMCVNPNCPQFKTPAEGNYCPECGNKLEPTETTGFCTNPKCPNTDVINAPFCPECESPVKTMGFRENNKIFKEKRKLKKQLKEIEKEEKKETEKKELEESIKKGIFGARNINNQNKAATITLANNSMKVSTQRMHILGRQGEENIVPYSAIQGVSVKRHGLGRKVEIKTTSQTYKFFVSHTTAFVDMLNEKINSTV